LQLNNFGLMIQTKTQHLTIGGIEVNMMMA